MPADIGVDTHGAAWADFDNDGDMDLIVLVGAGRGTGSGQNHLLVNDAGTFFDEATELGVDLPLGRGRAPLWLDWNRDGWLDVFLCNAQREDAPTSLFSRTTSGFEDVSDVVGLDIPKDSNFAQVLGFLNNRTLLFIHGNPYPQRVYDIDPVPLRRLQMILVWIRCRT